MANIKTDEAHLEETLSTLRFATRMASVSTTASLNTEVQLSPEAELQKCYATVRANISDVAKLLLRFVFV